MTTSALAALLERTRARLAASQQSSLPGPVTNSHHVEQTKEAAIESGFHQIINAYGQLITLNKEQDAFVNLTASKESCVLIGPAGTGKTTCTQAALSKLVQSGIPIISHTDGHKYLQSGVPGIVCVSFTRRAVRNLKRALSEDLKPTAITIHKLLEYAPQYYDVFDEASQEYKTTMRFEPTRNLSNPLPSAIKCCVIDESSMVSTELYDQLVAALPHDCQFIFIGDLCQLPPVFGSAILGYKGIELPVVELTEVYRQALESPIIELATALRLGTLSPQYSEKFVKETSQGKLVIHPWKKKLHQDVALMTAAKFFTSAMDAGEYNPEEDMILTPFNKACGTIELNKHIAQHIARKNKREVYEVIAGFNKHYFSVGDLVLCDKEDAVITRIERNGTFLGKRPAPHSLTLDYWGYDSAGTTASVDTEGDLEDIDAFLAKASSSVEEKVNVASHIITVQMVDSGEEVTLDSAAEINTLILSYALTGHKAQGSEFKKVFILLHQSHNTMLSREWIYTAVTRAKEELYIICEPDSLQKASKNVRIKGDTLAEKFEFFKGKAEQQGRLFNGQENGNVE